jgi:hypothetical protein
VSGRATGTWTVMVSGETPAHPTRTTPTINASKTKVQKANTA